MSDAVALIVTVCGVVYVADVLVMVTVGLVVSGAEGVVAEAVLE